MSAISRILAVQLVVAFVWTPQRAGADVLAEWRARMVEEQIVARGVTDKRVLAAMAKVPREEFIPAAMTGLAYDDRAVQFGPRQVVSQPYVVAFMAAALELQASDRVLEVGTGSGYLTAVLAELVKEVYAMDVMEPPGNAAAEVLRRLGYRNVATRLGDGRQGWPEEAPFDAIIATCAPDRVPPPLVAQLKDGGRMIIPVGPPGYPQNLVLLVKADGRLGGKKVLPVVFPKMREAE